MFVSVKKEKTVTITLDKEMSFSVLLHRVWKKHPTNVDFLGIYIPSTNKFSPKAHGLIGKVSADHLTSVGAILGREQLWVTLVRTWESDRGKLKSTASYFIKLMSERPKEVNATGRNMDCHSLFFLEIGGLAGHAGAAGGRPDFGQEVEARMSSRFRPGHYRGFRGKTRQSRVV